MNENESGNARRVGTTLDGTSVFAKLQGDLKELSDRMKAMGQNALTAVQRWRNVNELFLSTLDEGGIGGGAAQGADLKQLAALKAELKEAQVQRDRALAEKRMLAKKLERAGSSDGWPTADDDDEDDELEKLREEKEELSRKVIALKRAAEAVPDLKGQIKDLEEQNAHLRSMGVVKQKSMRQTMFLRPDGLSESLRSVLEGLSHDESFRGAVLADRSGLPVSGVAKHVDALAAVAAMFNDFGEKVADMLPLDDIFRMTLTDANDVTVTAQPFEFTDEEMILATLTVGPGPERSEVEKLRKEVFKK